MGLIFIIAGERSVACGLCSVACGLCKSCGTDHKSAPAGRHCGLDPQSLIKLKIENHERIIKKNTIFALIKVFFNTNNLKCSNHE
jgi:hypothetical protein